MKRLGALLGLVVLFTGIGVSSALSQGLEVPRRHDRPPGPPLSPEEAVAKMTVPEGFSVEIVAAEPQIANPVAMFIDEKGRFWITESFEYPRREPGPGRDRIKVLEDTDGDGKVDKVTVFAEGLNIPSGIAVGHGGVWVANAPDLLFLQDTDGDLKADKQEVIVTGFGRTDTHELPNSFTWGPDGWLYGLNGVFNYCDVKYAETNPNYKPDHPGWKFTCALWRVHPRTREFQIFCEGTSNPWGLAINDEGDFFVSACVIDHLWHLVETAYYRRQGGPYPPHTWPIESIVQHRHQKAAYCGLTWFDSDAYPEEYRKTLYMGNIHGGCINADVLERNGSTYKGKPHPGFTAKPQAWKDDEYSLIRKTGDADKPKLADLLTANDAWFMPVVQTTGPDGCLYILDWYDRYHCYQDANADPAGIDRAKGRLYRLRYKDTPHAQPFDLAKKTDNELIELLGSPNVFYRASAQRLLSERQTPASAKRLNAIVANESESAVQRVSALWSLAGMDALEPATHAVILRGNNPVLQAWGVRLAGNQGRDVDHIIGGMVNKHLHSAELPASVALQVVIAWPKIEKELAGVTFLFSQSTDQGDLLDHVVWQNVLKRLTDQNSTPIVQALEMHYHSGGQRQHPEFASRFFARLLEFHSLKPAMRFFNCIVLHDRRKETGENLASILSQQIRQGTIQREKLQEVQSSVSKLKELLKEEGRDVPRSFAVLEALWGSPEAQATMRMLFADNSQNQAVRLEALKTLIASRDEQVLASVDSLFSQKQIPNSLRSEIIAALGGVSQSQVADILLKHYDSFEPDLKPKAIEVLCQRAITTVPLLQAIQAGRIDKSQLNLNQLRRIATFKDAAVQSLREELYGSIRDGRNPNREQVFYRLRDFLRGTPGDAFRGEAVFKKVCGQCHKIYGEGAEVGPDLTRNGRNDWDQLLWNVLDPSQVIGPGYQARILITDDGRTLTGLPVEESDQQVVLKIQGGKLETIPRSQIELYKISEVSMMPDELEKQLTPQELADLISYLSLDKPPSDPTAKRLPGAN